MKMNGLKNLLTEKNISVKDFSVITKVKMKKLNRVLEGRAFFTDSELKSVSAFLGVSKNEIYHGVFERKGELPEVAENNNLNHFRYYVKNRFKNYGRALNFLSVISGFAVVAVAILYIFLTLAGISGLPSILRSYDVLFLCFIIPVFGISMLVDISRYKILEKKTTPTSRVSVEAILLSLLLVAFTITSFVNDFIPVESLVLTVIGAILLSLISLISPFKKKPFKNRALQFIVYMLPTVILAVAEIFTYNYVVEITPEEEGTAGEALATAADFFSMVFCVLIIGVAYFSLVLLFNVLVKGAGQFFKPVVNAKAISKGKLFAYIGSAILFAVVTFMCIWVAQGVYLKYVYSVVFEGQEDTVNWTSEYITDYESQFKEGEYDVIKFENMEIKIPEGYPVDKTTEFTTIYKKDDNNSIFFSKPVSDVAVDFDLFDEDFGDGKYTEEQIREMKASFVDTFGFYPQSMYDWHVVQGSVTLDDIDIFNPRKTAMLSTALVMKSVAGIPDSEYYLYENGDLYASINIHTIENEEKGNREIANVTFGSPDLEYSFNIVHPDHDNDIIIEEITKILNSVKTN